jgi:penicillin-binding protein 1A
MVLGAVTLLGAYLYFGKNLPSVDTLEDTHYQEPLRVYSSDNKLIAEFGDKRRIPKTYEEIPKQLIDAFIAAEDNRYWDHFGIDLKGILRAGLVYLWTGKKKQGASTITMQVARNFFLTPEKTLKRKIKEMFLATKIEKKFSKEKIIELYLNKIYLGKRSYGVAAAAQIYYKKKLEELTLSQAAMIAGLPKAPSAYNPVANPNRAKLRRDYVLRRMYKMEIITAEELADALATEVTAKQYYASVESQAPYLAEMVRADMQKLFPKKVYTSGFKVYTTISSKLQKVSNNAVQNNLIRFTKRHGYRGAIGTVSEALLSDKDSLIVKLKKIPTFSQIFPSVVIKVSKKEAEVLMASGESGILSLSSVKWAREKKGNNKLGVVIKSVNQVLTVGDIVYLNNKKNKLELSQLPLVEGALVAISPDDGRVLSLSGGFDFHHSKFNRVTQAIRQVGSNFKPFLYSAALNKGYTAASIINDAPVVFNDSALEGQWKPQNYSGRVYGPTRLRKALVNSRNLVSIRILLGIKIAYARNYAKRFGFSNDELPQDLSLSLGSGSLVPMKLVNAYTVFANGGYRVGSRYINRIENRDGDTIYQAKYVIACPQCDRKRNKMSSDTVLSELQHTEKLSPIKKILKDNFVGPLNVKLELAPQVIDPRNAFIMRTLLMDVVKRGTARRAHVLGRNDLAGKTGTTNDQHDAWFTGFNSKIVATAWVGFDKYQSLGNRETGSKAALPMWIDYMKTALKAVPNDQLVQPEGIVSILIDKDTGKATSGHKNSMFEYFRKEFVPKPPEIAAQNEIMEAGETEEIIEDELF